MQEKPVIICLTPVKNEAWILDLFLKCASVWADHIILADQNSTDGSREIALNYHKVILIENSSKEYNEIGRQRLLLNRARKINGNKLLITLDADEFLSSDFSSTDEWQTMLNGRPGDSFAFRWINVLPDFKKGWKTGHFVWALIDDGTDHNGEYIHSPRLPVKDQNKIVFLEKINVLHYQYVNWNRMESKHRYYQCLERINDPAKSPVELYRMYHHMYCLKPGQLFSLNENIFNTYEKDGIEMRGKTLNKKAYWFDREVLDLFKVYGVKRFKKESIWDLNWNNIAEELNYSRNDKFQDPRNIYDKLIHSWLKLTQPVSNNKKIRRIDRILNRTWNFKFTSLLQFLSMR